MHELLQRVSKIEGSVHLGFEIGQSSLEKKTLPGDIDLRNTVYCSANADYELPNLSVDGLNNFIYVGDQSFFKDAKLIIRGNNNTLVIGPGAKARNDRFTLIGNDTSLLVGRGATWVGGGQVLCESDATHIVIGDDCMVAYGVVIRTSEGHTIWTRDSLQLVNPPASVILEPHVWIGNSAKVSKGCTIGTGSIIAQNSVAKGVLKPNCVYAGAPARCVRENVVWSRGQSYKVIPTRFL